MIDIIVINYNYKQHVIKLIDSLIDCQRYSKINQTITVIDNDSRDGSQLILQRTKDKKPKDFNLSLLIKNKGYSFAVNHGAKQGKNPYIMILNSDMLVLDNLWKEKFIKTFELDDKIAVMGCKLIDQFNKVVGAGTCGSFQQRKFRAYGVEDNDNPESIFNQMAECINVCGAAYMVRRDIFEKLGGFDEDFFMYHEEEYFSIQVQKLMGMKVLYIPFTKFLHYSGAHKGGNEAKYIPEATKIFIKKCREELGIEGVQ